MVHRVIVMARRTILTPEKIHQICELVQAGNNLETSAAACGVSKSAFFNWTARGRREQERLAANPKARPKKTEEIYVDLVEDIEKARATADARLVLLIHKAAQEPKTWQAAAWLLERRDPARWGRTSRENAQAKNEGAKGEVQKAVQQMATMATPLPVENPDEWEEN